MDDTKNKSKKSSEVKPQKTRVEKNKSIQFTLAIIILVLAGAFYLYFLNNKNSTTPPGGVTPSTPILTSINSSNSTFNNTFSSNNASSQNASTSNNSATSNVSSNSSELNATQPVNQTLNQTVNYTQLCLNSGVYVGNFNLATRNLNYSWAPYYGVFYARIYVDYSSSLGKPFADVSDISVFNGTDCSYTPIFEGQTVVLPACNFIMKVNSISLTGGVWVANVDISHC